MLHALSRRGPEAREKAASRDKRALFGHNMLSIQNVGRNPQPRTKTYGTNSCMVSFNGEIYNHRELRMELESKHGMRFESESDTEVILAAYFQWGKNCVSHFNGDFAFAIYDNEREGLFLARDRFGIKPLHYIELGEGEIAFASEPKALLQVIESAPRPNLSSFAEYVIESFAMTDAAFPLGSSFYHGIKSVLPGHVAWCGGGKVRLQRYWRTKVWNPDAHEPDSAQIHDALLSAVKIRMSDEVPYGIALSGGLDSSIVASVANKFDSRRVKAYTIRFDGTANPDFDSAKSFTDQLRFGDPTAVTIESARLEAEIDDLVTAFDGPHDSIRQLGLLSLYRQMHLDGLKVALVGEGADEFNLGYYHSSPGFEVDQSHVDFDFRSAWKQRLPAMKTFLSEGLVDAISPEDIIDRVVDEYYDPCPSPDRLDKMRYFYSQRFLNYRLEVNDRTAMWSAVEARVPYCDHTFASMCLAVPNSANISDGLEKQMLRKAFQGHVPQDVLLRQKYPLPESRDLPHLKALARIAKSAVETAPADVWLLLNQKGAQSLCSWFKGVVDRVAHDEWGRLSFETNLTDKFEYRMKHVFLLVTAIKWFTSRF
jgi:asparagine synthase (glutamine-hydrolysing)